MTKDLRLNIMIMPCSSLISTSHQKAGVGDPTTHGERNQYKKKSCDGPVGCITLERAGTQKLAHQS